MEVYQNFIAMGETPFSDIIQWCENQDKRRPYYPHPMRKAIWAEEKTCINKIKENYYGNDDDSDDIDCFYYKGLVPQ
jgi:hypothetical protein